MTDGREPADGEPVVPERWLRKVSMANQEATSAGAGQAADQRRDHMLRAALDVIGERGFPETRIADVAERAGTSPALVIYYFKTKDNLLTEAMRYAEDTWYDLGARRIEAVESAARRLEEIVAMTCLPEADDELPDSWTLWLDLWAQSVRHPEVARVREEFDAHWRETIADVVRDGQATRRVRRRRRHRLRHQLCRPCSTASPSRSPWTTPSSTPCGPSSLHAALAAQHSASSGRRAEARRRPRAKRREGLTGGAGGSRRRRRLPRVDGGCTGARRRGTVAERRSRRRGGRRMTAGGEVQIVSLTKRFDDVEAVAGIDLHIGRGEFFSILGPSGCGKTTTLRLVAGFEQPTSGSIFLDGEDVANRPPHKRKVNTVFQSYALFPFLTVAENVAFGLRYQKLAKAEVASRVGTALELVQLLGLREAAAAASCRGASSNGWPWPGPWCSIPPCCCSTSRWAPSTPSCGGPCRSSSSPSRRRWGSPSSTSPTTRRRRSPCPTGWP